MINKVTLIGHLGADPEVRRLDNGTAVGRFSLATNESYKDAAGEWQTVTEWHNVVVWREAAERAEKMLKKGMQVYVEGKITYRKYTDKENQERYVTDIVANTFRMLERREGAGSSFAERNFPTNEPVSRTAGSSVAEMPANGEAPPVTTDGGDDLPF